MFIKYFIQVTGIVLEMLPVLGRNVERMQDMLACVSTQAVLALNAFHQSYINIPCPRGA